MKLSKFKFIALIALSVICFGFMAKLVISYSLASLLATQASSIGRNWSHYLDNRLGEELPVLSHGADAIPIADDKLGVVVDAVSEIFGYGRILQIDFIDASCNCFATFINPLYFDSHTSYDPDSDQRPNGNFAIDGPLSDHSKLDIDHSVHEHLYDSDSRVMDKSRTSQEDLNFILTHVTYGNIATEPVKEGPADFLAIDNAPVDLIWNQQLNHVQLPLVSSGILNYPIGETYHRVQRGGDEKLVVRLVTDLKNIAARNQTIGLVTSGIVLVLLLLVFGYPAARHIESLRARRKADAKAYFLAHHDVLTGLSNRNAFQEQVPKMLAQAQADGFVGSLVLLDVDNFKQINDFYGHHVGDLVLQRVADVLNEQVPAGSMVARLGGDELAVVSFHHAAEKNRGPGNCQFSSSIPVELEGGEGSLDVTFSIGISRFPRDGTELPALMRNADLALYDAKNRGKATAREYRPEMKIGFDNRQILLNEFRAGLKSSQILPFYQPIICMRTGRVAAVEALVRWQHPQKGLLSASDFSEVFDHRELSELIGCQMIDKVTKDMARWKETNVPFERVGFNVNAANLLRDSFVMEIISALSRNRLSPRELAIEVTEKTTCGTNSKALCEKLHELRRMGCEVVLDDFGTGSSSITHLKMLPYSFLKIARTFMSNITHDPEDQAIVSSLIKLGQSLDYKMVAEGVETYEQYEKVRELGFHLSQGYFYSEPVSAAQLPMVIDSVRARSFRNVGPQNYQEDVA